MCYSEYEYTIRNSDQESNVKPVVNKKKNSICVFGVGNRQV